MSSSNKRGETASRLCRFNAGSSRARSSHDGSFNHGRWHGIEHSVYKSRGNDFRRIHRTVFPMADEQAFELRYFELEPGGFSSYERHNHSHSVIVLCGSGTVLLDRKAVPVACHDHLLIAPGSLHRFIASNGEPLGFLCIVDRRRDRPTAVSEEELAELAEDPVIGPILSGLES